MLFHSLTVGLNVPHKQLKNMCYVLLYKIRDMATNILVLKHQAISNHGSDSACLVRRQIKQMISHMLKVPFTSSTIEPTVFNLSRKQLETSG